MDKYELRRQRLIELKAQKCGNNSAELARRIGREPSYVTRMLYAEGKPGRKRIAEDMVQIIEDAFGIPGWFSQPKANESAPSAPTINTGHDARASLLVAHFYWLTDAEKDEVLRNVKAMADGNRVVLKQLSGKLNPPSDDYIDKLLNGKKRTQHKGN